MFTDLVIAFQHQSLLCIGRQLNLSDFPAVLINAKDRYLYCLRHKRLKHSPSCIIRSADEYTSFLLFLALSAFKEGEDELAESIYLVNRRINGIDCFYTRQLPDIFHLEHPLGSILGAAVYSNYFVCYQSVTVGGNTSLEYPRFEEGVVMYAHSMVAGSCHLGFNSSIGANVMLYNETLENDSILKSVSGAHVKSFNRINNIERFFVVA